MIHLRELRVDSNLLTSLQGILQLDGLLKVSAKHNQISSLDFTGARLPRLEVIECQQNCISWVEALEELHNLMSLHLGIHHNYFAYYRRQQHYSAGTKTPASFSQDLKTVS